MNPDGILIDFLEAGKQGLDIKMQEILPDSDKFDEAVSELERFSLIKRQDDDTITIHRLVQAVIKDEMAPELFSATAVAILSLCNSAFPHWDTSSNYRK